MNLEYFDLFRVPPGPRTIARHGRPALCVPYNGMPAYESESGTVLVMEALVVHTDSEGRPLMMPRSYGVTAAVAPSGLAALHHDPDALWTWRPLLYELKHAYTQRLGSQQELEWRQGLSEAIYAQSQLSDLLTHIQEECLAELVPFEEYLRRADRLIEAWEPTLPFTEANARADRILREFLEPQQILDLDTGGGFYVRGTINRLYRIELGNGCSIVHPETRSVLVSICIHPDDWMPHADVALATKLLIDSGVDGEEQVLSTGRATALRGRVRGTRRERAAWERERALLPRPPSEIAC